MRNNFLPQILMISCLAFAIGGASATTTPPTHPELRIELLQMMTVDQSAREAAISGTFKDSMANRRMDEVDRTNTRSMRAIVDRYGWPALSMVGEDGAHAAWLLAQHADRDIAFQEHCLRLMEPLLTGGQVSKPDFAYLTDRVLVNQGRLQRYGTQMLEVNGEYEPQPVEAPENLETRRVTMGLPTMTKYKKKMLRTYGPRKSKW